MTQEYRPTPPAEHDFRTLPAGVELEETIASVEPDDLPDPDAGRNNEHYNALRDD